MPCVLWRAHKTLLRMRVERDAGGAHQYHSVWRKHWYMEGQVAPGHTPSTQWLPQLLLPPHCAHAPMVEAASEQHVSGPSAIGRQEVVHTSDRNLTAT